jgi:cytoskeletal protein CcmA (bactofilin family)
MPTQSGAILSQGVSIKGSVKFLNELLIDGEVEGTIDSTGTLTLGEHARIRGEIRTKSLKVRGTVEGNVFVTERCELQAGCTLRGDIEAPRLMVDENATFLGSAKVGTGKSLPAWRFAPGLVIEVKSRCVRIIPAASALLSAATAPSFSAVHMTLWFAFTIKRATLLRRRR